MMYLFSLIVTALISTISNYIFTCKISNTKFNINYKKIIIFIIINIIFLLNWIYIDGFNRVLINVFISLLLNYFIIFDHDYKKSIYYTLVFFIIASFAEIFISIIFTIIFNDKGMIRGIGNYNLLIYSILISITLLLFSKINILKNKLIEFFNSIQDKITEFIFLLFITIYILLFTFNNFEKIHNNMNFYMNMTMFILVIITLIVIVFNIMHRKSSNQKLTQMLEYVSKYEKIINEQGERNHEYINQLMVLESYIDNKKKLKEYLNLIINDQKGGQNYTIKQLSCLPDGGLKGLMYYKLGKMDDNKIKYFLDIDKDLNDIFNKISLELYKDITKIFGVYIDNAIDASINSNQKEVLIDIKREKNNIIITITNTYNKIDKEKFGRIGYSTKGSGHGFGLLVVKDICSKNNNIETYFDITNDVAVQTIKINVNKK